MFAILERCCVFMQNEVRIWGTRLQDQTPPASYWDYLERPWTQRRLRRYLGGPAAL